MPWKETCPVDERKAFIKAWKSQKFSKSALCRRFGISRKTGDKWINRVLAEGQAGLVDRSRAAHHRPNRTPQPVVRALLKAKHQNPDWGPGTLIRWLRRCKPSQAWPAPSTAGEILKRHGLVKPRKKRKKVPPHTEPLRHATAPHRLWSADFKGQFQMGDARWCYPLTITDNYSRFLITCKGLYGTALDPVKYQYELAFRRWGLPAAIRTDNGYPFASCGIGGLNALSIWLLKLGVTPERIAPGHPEQNPRHERMHRTLKAAAINPAKANLSAQQRAFNRFWRVFNYERPHQGLDDRCPASLIRVSTRPYPDRLPDVTYPQSYRVRRVRSDGSIKWRGRLLYVSTALAGEPLGMQPVDNDQWQLSYARLVLGILDDRLRRIIRPS